MNRWCGPVFTVTVPVCRSTSSAPNGPTGTGSDIVPAFGRDWRTTAVTSQSAPVESAGSAILQTGLPGSPGRMTTGS